MIKERTAVEINWHALEGEEVCGLLGVSSQTGLSEQQALVREEHYGRNAIGEVKGPSNWELFVSQFKSLVIVLLLVAAAISFALDESADAVAILLAVFLNAGIGFATESRAERAMDALRQLGAPTARVLRASAESEIPSTMVVPGDIVILSPGARVPADGRLLEASNLGVDESPLTGESTIVDKYTLPIEAMARVVERNNTVYLGTTVVRGHGIVVVTATGSSTEMGRIGHLVAETPHEATPLETAIEDLGRRLIWVILVAAVLVIAVGVWHAESFLQMLETGVVLAIAAVPEGLPAVATIALAWGLQRLARRNAIVRRLSAVETLGSTTIICTDKTGTLTENVITLQIIDIADKTVEVTGTGYDPIGSFVVDNAEVNPREDPAIRLALEIGTLCNNATIETNERDGWHSHGDPIEAALLVAARKAGIDRQKLEWERPRIGEIPFEEKRKTMATFNATAAGVTFVYLKGAPNIVLGNCSAVLTAGGEAPMTEGDIRRFLERNQTLAARGLRVLGLAYKRLDSPADMAEDLRDLTFVGLVGMRDPVRPDVKTAIARAERAGIRTVMITGDQSPTAMAVANELRLSCDGKCEAMEAGELLSLPPERYKEILRKIAVFARVAPEDKLRIVRAFQEAGEIVAMTGDGINDAPALRAAHIGVALGARGADVAKQAADVVIADDNFSTIVLAIEQGRVIYTNIQRAIRFLLTASFAAILATLFVIPLDIGLPLLPLQILWLNLLGHSFPAMALSLERGDPAVMLRPPRDPRESILPVRLLVSIAARSALIGLAAAIAFYWAVSLYGPGNRSTTFAFTILALGLMLHTLNLRSDRPLFGGNHRPANPYIWAAIAIALGLQALAIYAPGLQQLLRTYPLTMADLGVVAVAATTPFLLIELWKAVVGQWGGRDLSHPR